MAPTGSSPPCCAADAEYAAVGDSLSRVWTPVSRAAPTNFRLPKQSDVVASISPRMSRWAQSQLLWLLCLAACSGDDPETAAPVEPALEPAPLAETSVASDLVRFGVSCAEGGGRVADFMAGVDAAFVDHAVNHPLARRCELFVLNDRGMLPQLGENLAFLRDREAVDFQFRGVVECGDFICCGHDERVESLQTSDQAPWMRDLRASAADEVVAAIAGLCSAGVPPAAIGLVGERSGFGERAIAAGIGALAARGVDPATVPHSRLDPLLAETGNCLIELGRDGTLPRAVVVAATGKPCLAFLRLARSKTAIATVCLSAVSIEEVAAAYPEDSSIGVLTGVDPAAGTEAAHWLSYCGKSRPVTAAVREGYLAGRMLTEAIRSLGRRTAWEQFVATLAAIGREEHSTVGFRRAGSTSPSVWLQVVDHGAARQAEWGELVTARAR